jgi:hypothetical protein
MGRWEKKLRQSSKGSLVAAWCSESDPSMHRPWIECCVDGFDAAETESFDSVCRDVAGFVPTDGRTVHGSPPL